VTDDPALRLTVNNGGEPPPGRVPRSLAAINGRIPVYAGTLGLGCLATPMLVARYCPSWAPGYYFYGTSYLAQKNPRLISVAGVAPECEARHHRSVLQKPGGSTRSHANRFFRFSIDAFARMSDVLFHFSAAR
jgi:hypothetical protein